MAKDREKSEDLDILSEIYQNSQYNFNQSPKEPALAKIKKYFSDPKKVDHWLAGAVLFFGFFGLFFGFSHFKNQLSGPFKPKTDKQLALQDTAGSDMLGLKNKDTDQDGLSDYDETYVYQTSVYLEDTDSDGIDDKKEIERGSSPTCPVGQDCLGLKENQVQNPEFGLNSEDAGTSPTPADQDYMTQLRDLLGQTGLDTSGLSDQQINEAYQETIAETNNQGSPAIASTTVGGLDNLTPDQLRDLLLAKGVSADILSQVSDSELMQMAQETAQGQ